MHRTTTGEERKHKGMTITYPGSKMKQKSYGPNYKPPPLPDDTVVDLGDPKQYLVRGVETDLYQMSSLSAALNRQPVTIRKWEADGVIPQPTYLVGSHDARAKRRLYTKDQLLGLRRIAEEEGILYPNANGKWKPVEQTDFRRKALELFKQLERQ